MPDSTTDNKQEHSTAIVAESSITGIGAELVTALEHISSSNTQLTDQVKNIESLVRFAELNPNPAFRVACDGKILQYNPASSAFIKTLSDEDNIESLIPALEPDYIRYLVSENQNAIITERVGQRWMQLSLKGISDLNFLQVYATDISELVEAKRAIEDEKVKVEKANQAKNRFLAMMSHELRTPLNAIIGFNDIARKKQPNKEVDTNLSYIESSAHKLLGMIERLLDYTQFEDFNIEQHTAALSFHKMFAELQQEYEGIATKKNLRFEVKIETEENQYFMGDYLRIKQVLDNLLDNAFKFTNDGGVTLSLAQIYDFEKLVISVEDSGPGISEDDKESIFDIFSKSDSAFNLHREGSGIGLSLCRKISQAMGGDIQVEDAPGGGSIFHFTLKLSSVDCETATQEKHIETNTDVGVEFDNIELFVSEDDASNDHSTDTNLVDDEMNWDECIDEEFDTNKYQYDTEPQLIRTLVVEDNTINQELIQLILNDINADYEIAKHGQEALEIIDQVKPDIILMDKQMPVMDGIETTKAIRNLEPWSDTPIIAVTANVLDTDKKECFDAGMNDFIGKPINSTHLYKKIQELTGIEVVENNRIQASELDIYDLSNAKPFFPDRASLDRALTRFIKEHHHLALEDKVLKTQLIQIQENDLTLSAPEYFQLISTLSNEEKIDKETRASLFTTHKKFIRSIEAELSPSKNKTGSTAQSFKLKIPGIETDTALSRFDGNEQRYIKMLQGFSENHSRQLYTCRLYLLRNCKDDARRAAHTTKGLAATVGAASLHGISEQLEQAITEDKKDIDSLINEYEAQFFYCVKQIKQGLKTSDLN